MKKVRKNNTLNIEKTRKRICKELSEETIEFLEVSNRFFKENNIRQKEFSYQTGLSFRS